MRTVGVEYDGRVFVVGFEVNGGSSISAVTGLRFGPEEGIDIISIEEFSKGSTLPLSDYEAGRVAASFKFRAATLYAIADFNGEDFDPKTFRRMN